MATPPTTTSARTCGHHRRREAVGTCVACERALCRDCMNPTGVGFKCGPCTGAGRRSERKARRPGAPTWLRPAALAATMAVVLAVVAANLVGGGGEEEVGVGGTGEQRALGAAIERQVQFDGAGRVGLAGTLTLPPGHAAAGAPLAGVVIVPGFGPTTRDGIVAPGAVPDSFYSDLGQTFTDAGMAVLRYDERGTGQSGLPPGQALSFGDMVADAGAAIGFLADRVEVDPGRIAVVGHEEGGLVALDLAGSDPRASSLVLVSVPGRPLLEVLADDIGNSSHAEEVDELRAVVEGLLAGEGVPDPTELPPFLASFFPEAEETYLEDIFSLDPVALAREVDVPTLIVRGEAATGISEADADALADALGPDSEVVVASGAGPTLQISEPSAGVSDDMHGESSPALNTGRDTQAMARITEFLVRTTD